MGPERKSMMISDKEKRVTAFHEAGHALVGMHLPNTDPIHKDASRAWIKSTFLFPSRLYTIY